MARIVTMNPVKDDRKAHAPSIACPKYHAHFVADAIVALPGHLNFPALIANRAAAMVQR